MEQLDARPVALREDAGAARELQAADHRDAADRLGVVGQSELLDEPLERVAVFRASRAELQPEYRVMQMPEEPRAVSVPDSRAAARVDRKAPDRASAHRMESAVPAAAQDGPGPDLVKVKAELAPVVRLR